jgi:thiamine-phosphate pyrophosphorylase
MTAIEGGRKRSSSIVPASAVPAAGHGGDERPSNLPEVFGLYLVMTDPVVGYEACAEAAVRRRVGFLQLRMKDALPEAVRATARAIREITAGSCTRFIVNDDVDLARQVNADGVHLGQRDLPLDEARRRWPAPGRIFGLSTHDEGQELRARALAPDYVGVGPVFATPTKAVPDPVLGLERMGAIVRSSPLTTVAIGGITRENLAQVLQQGAVNFCVVRAVMRSPDPESAIAELQELWERECSRARARDRG